MEEIYLDHPIQSQRNCDNVYASMKNTFYQWTLRKNFQCRFSGCARSYTTEDTRRRHYRAKHADEWALIRRSKQNTLANRKRLRSIAAENSPKSTPTLPDCPPALPHNIPALTQGVPALPQSVPDIPNSAPVAADPTILSDLSILATGPAFPSVHSASSTTSLDPFSLTHPWSPANGVLHEDTELQIDFNDLTIFSELQTVMASVKAEPNHGDLYDEISDFVDKNGPPAPRTNKFFPGLGSISMEKLTSFLRYSTL